MVIEEISLNRSDVSHAVDKINGGAQQQPPVIIVRPCHDDLRNLHRKCNGS